MTKPKTQEKNSRKTLFNYLSYYFSTIFLLSHIYAIVPRKPKKKRKIKTSFNRLCMIQEDVRDLRSWYILQEDFYICYEKPQDHCI